MASSRAVSVATTATDLTATSITGASYERMLIYNNGSATIYVGGANVTTSNGLPVAPGASLGVGARAEVYGIVASGTVEARVLEGV
jgi:hypothetical protein